MNLPFLETFLEFFPTAFVSVWMDFRSCSVKLAVYKKDKLIHEEHRNFKSFGNDVPIEAQRLIFEYQESYRFCYVGTMFKGSNQGAIPAYKKSDYERFGVKLEDIEIIPVNGRWSFYAYGSDMVSTKSRYDKSGGIDYIFSPFFLVYSFFREKFTKDSRLYLLIQKSSVTITIFKEDMLLYSSFFILESATEVVGHSAEESSDGDDIDELVEDSDDEDTEHEDGEQYSKGGSKDEEQESAQNLDELVSLDEEFEDIGELEELNDEEKIEEFQEEKPQKSESQKSEKDDSQNDEEMTDSLDELGRGMNIISFVKSSLNEYYKNEIYESCFIEEVEIADAIGVSQEVLDYIKDELLLNINVAKIDLAEEICKAVRLEAENAK